VRGRIISVNLSEKRGVSKQPRKEVYLKEGYGVLGDAHAGGWHRQVSLLGWESVRRFTLRKKISRKFQPGDFAENITVDVDLSSLKVGDYIKLGENVMIRVTQIGKRCHEDCSIYRQVGECLMPREGIFAEVIKGGMVHIGDKIEVVDDKDRNNYRKR